MVKGLVYPKITQYGMDTEKYTYFYAVDERIGTVYLLFNALNRAGIMNAVNPDGTPVTKEQLKAWRDDESLGSD